MKLNVGDEFIYMNNNRIYTVKEITKLKILEENSDVVCHVMDNIGNGLKIKMDKFYMPSSKLYVRGSETVHLWSNYFIKLDRIKYDKIQFEPGITYNAYILYASRNLTFKLGELTDNPYIVINYNGDVSPIDIERARLLIYSKYWDCKEWD